MRKSVLTLILFSVFMMVFTSCGKEKKPIYLDTSLSFEERVDDLVSRMTLEQKIAQLSFDAPGIDSLNVGPYNWWNECLHGVARSGLATVFPQAIGMAATWDKDLMHRIGRVISDEARAKYNDYQAREKYGIYQGLTFWTPNINIFRDPRWGRGMETYGEDPYLTGKIGTEFIKGLQGNHPKYFQAIATSKHYVVHSGPEPERHSFNAITNEIDFRETYLPAFKRTIQEGGAYSAMCAYNRYLGEPCCGSNYLLNELLREEIGFEGYVVSDCGAIRDFFDGHNIVETPEEAAAQGVASGTDLNCGDVYPSLVEAAKQGLISEQEIDIAVKRLFLARFKLGMFDPAEDVPFNSISLDVVDSEPHKATALEAARKSMVLLKNDGLLPLNRDYKNIAVIGPNANDVEVLLANYNGIPSNPVTPYEGIKLRLPDANVKYALGCEHAENLPTFEVIGNEFLFTDESKMLHGLKMEYFDNREFNGQPVKDTIAPNIDYYWWDKAPLPDLNDDNFGVRWTGVIVPKESGRYALGAEGFNDFNMYIDGEEFLSFTNIHHSNKQYKFVELKAGQAYKLRLDFMEHHGDAFMKLLWSPPKGNLEEEALQLARRSDIVVLCMGLSPRLEGEEMKVQVDGFRGGDRLIIGLPKLQQDFIKKIHALGKPTVLVMLNGSAVAINWAQDNMSAILEAWYPGQASGEAIADVIFGDYNPAGRLPVTFYKSADDLPDFENYEMKGRTYRYYQGDVFYPFGHCLSYTTFEYSAPNLDKTKISANEPITLTVDVSNTGSMDGDEVVQLYLAKKFEGEGRSIKALKGFEREFSAAGETKTVSFLVEPEELAFYSPDEGDYIVAPGTYSLMVGSSSADNALKSIDFEVEN